MKLDQYTPSKKATNAATVRSIPDYLFSQAIKEAGIGIVVTGSVPEGNPLLFANPHFLKLTGYSEDEVLGRNCRFLQGPDTDPNEVAKIRCALKSGEGYCGEILNCRKDGSQFWHRLTLSPVRQINQAPNYWIGFQEDVTERVKLKWKTESLVKKLNEANNELVHFARMIAHDVRAPLRNIRQFGELLRSKHAPALNSEAREFIDYIVTSTEKMSTLTDGIIAYSQIGQGSEDLCLIDTNSLIENVIESLGPDAVKRVKILGALLPIIGKRTSLQQLFQNLIDNGLKHGTPNEAKVEISCTQNEGFVEFNVSNDGAPIPLNKVELLFEPFRKMSGESDGPGLGLSIVKRIVEQHGGQIRVHSTFPNRTTFTFTIPDTENDSADRIRL